MLARIGTVIATIGCVATLAACASSSTGAGSGSSAQPVTSASSSPPSSSAAPSSSSAGGTGGAAGSAAATEAQPPSTPAPSTSAPATVVTTAPGIFVGTWDGHSRRLVFSSAGAINVDYRLYVTCSPTSGPPCDKITGNTIHDGGHVRLHLVRVVTARHTSTASATVTTTTDPAYPVGTTQTFTLVGDIIDSRWGTFCDVKAGGQCGA